MRTHLKMSSVVVDWRLILLPLGEKPSPPDSPSGLRCGRESRRFRFWPPDCPSSSSAAESGDSESRLDWRADTIETPGGASGDRKGRDPRRPVRPPIGMPRAIKDGRSESWAIDWWCVGEGIMNNKRAGATRSN